MNFLVTGLTGFAAPHLAKLLLRKNHTVFGIIRGSNGRQMDLLDVMTAEEINSIHWIYADLCRYSTVLSALEKIRLDGVFHLAAQSHPPTSFTHPIDTFECNVTATVNLLDVIHKTQDKKCKFHFCSTSEVYGNACSKTGILTEELPLTPCNPYGVSKAAIDLYMQERIMNGCANGFITRAFSHTGPRRGFNFSISSDAYQIAKMMCGLQDKKLLIGNLKTRRVVIDVRDCVEAYYQLMMDVSTNGVYNVCGSDVHEMQVFTDLLIELSELTGITKVINPAFYREIDIDVQIGDSSRLFERTKWSPKIDIRTTLNDLLFYWVHKLK